MLTLLFVTCNRPHVVNKRNLRIGTASEIVLISAGFGNLQNAVASDGNDRTEERNKGEGGGHGHGGGRNKSTCAQHSGE